MVWAAEKQYSFTSKIKHLAVAVWNMTGALKIQVVLNS